MDQGWRETRGDVLDQVHEVINENSSSLVEGVTIDGSSLEVVGDKASINGQVGTSSEVGKDSGSNNNKELKEEPEEVKGQENCDQGTSYNSINLVNHEVVETVVMIESVQSENVNEEDRKLDAKADESGGLSLVSMKATKGVSETDEDSCVIDMKCSSQKGFYENSQGERICRICHLSSGQASDTTVDNSNSATTSVDLIQLGCACKDELGIAHIHCAEAWFKLKGNRLCEICGETAKNVSGVANNGFMEEWNGRRFNDNDLNSTRSFSGCWRGQPFCNFLMACLVIAFVLPWFFRVNMF